MAFLRISSSSSSSRTALRVLQRQGAVTSRTSPRRLASSSSSSSPSSSNPNVRPPQPAPPRLPSEQQAEFERLQRSAMAALEAQDEIVPPDHAASNKNTSTRETTSSSSSQSVPLSYRGAPDEFEGETNPRTGEVGGPKKEPLRWGGKGDWSYNGRVTDF